MNPSQPFIRRPVATTLLMVAIMLSGILAFRFLPVAALPEFLSTNVLLMVAPAGVCPKPANSGENEMNGDPAA